MPLPPVFIFTGGTIGFGPRFGGGPNLTPPLLYALKGKKLDAVKDSVVFLTGIIGFFNTGCIESFPLSPPVGGVGALLVGTVYIGDPDNLAFAMFFSICGVVNCLILPVALLAPS